MRRVIFFSGWLLVLVLAGWWLAASADSYLVPDLSVYREEELVTTTFPDGQQKNIQIKTWVKGDKVRTDAAEGMDVTIVRSDLNLVYTINLNRMVYSEVPLSIYQRGARLSMVLLATDPAYRLTGRKKKIGRWSCREVIMAEQTGISGQNMKTIWWVSNDPPLDLRMLRHFMTLTFGSESDDFSMRFFEKLNSINAYPVQTETTATVQGQVLKRVQTLKRLEQRPIEDQVFNLPAGLTKILVPLPDGMNP